MNQYTIPNLVKAVDILKLLSMHSEGLTAVDIEKQVQVPRTTAFRILKTFISVGVVQKVDNLYKVGPTLFEIGIQTVNQLEIGKLAGPILKELTEATGYTSHLAVPSGKQSLIIEVCDSPHPVRVASRPGSTVSMHCSSTGKIFLSYLYAGRLKKHFGDTRLESRTEQTLDSIEALEAMTSTVKKQGYAVDEREYHNDIRCLAAPVFNHQEQVCAAIGITAPITHFPKSKIPGVSQSVTQAAQKLSQQLGAPSTTRS